jgi:hypothetical protein
MSHSGPTVRYPLQTPEPMTYRGARALLHSRGSSRGLNLDEEDECHDGPAKRAEVLAAEEKPMNGPDHYRVAEKLLAEAEKDATLGEPMPRAAWSLELAKVHMGLAIAAATALGDQRRTAWAEAAG